MEEKIQRAWDGEKWIHAVFIPIENPPPPPPQKVVIPQPRCIVRQTVAHIRRATYGELDRPFGVYPDHWGGRLDCLEWAREMANRLNLPVIEVPGANPDLRSRDFEAPAIYLCLEEFDQFNDKSGRVFRY